LKKLSIFSLTLSLILCFSFGWAKDINLKPGGVLDGDVLELFQRISDTSQGSVFVPGGIRGYSNKDLQVVGTILYTVSGNFYTKAPGTIDLSGITGGSALTEQTEDTYCKYLLSLNASGNWRIDQGKEVYYNLAVLPARQSGYTPIAYLLVNPTNCDFTLGTNLLDTANVVIKQIHALSSGPDGIALTPYPLEYESTASDEAGQTFYLDDVRVNKFNLRLHATSIEPSGTTAAATITVTTTNFITVDSIGDATIGTTVTRITTANIDNGTILYIQCENDARDIIFTETAANMKLGGATRTLSNTSDLIVLQLYDGYYWREVGFYDND
jgi:hypothetical protein